MSQPAAPPLVFDRKAVRLHRARAAAGGGAEFLFEHAALDILERLADIARPFGTALVAGSRRGTLARELMAQERAGLVIQGDPVLPMAGHSRAACPGQPVLVFDEEMVPFAEHSLDLILCPLGLHWLNDLPGALVQMQRALRPDGLLMANLLGGDTLAELRQSIMVVEMEMLGGAGPRISPSFDLRDAAGLMQRAGFALPVADAETVEVTYDSAFGLLRDLRAMGETGALLRRDRRIPPRAFWPKVVEHYDRSFAGPDGRAVARFEMFTLTGWHPHESQQKPLRPGSGQTDLAAHLGRKKS